MKKVYCFDTGAVMNVGMIRVRVTTYEIAIKIVKDISNVFHWEESYDHPKPFLENAFTWSNNDHEYALIVASSLEEARDIFMNKCYEYLPSWWEKNLWQKHSSIRDFSLNSYNNGYIARRVG